MNPPPHESPRFTGLTSAVEPTTHTAAVRDTEPTIREGSDNRIDDAPAATPVTSPEDKDTELHISKRAIRRRVLPATAVAAALAVAVPASAAWGADEEPKNVSAKGAYLLDAESGDEVWSKDADTARQMASTTKIMTATVAVKTKGALDKRVTVKKQYRDYVTEEGASTADLQVGDKLTVRQLLKGLMLPSGCDAAYAIADTLGSGETMKERTSDFIAKMNATAKELGLENTKFDSFDGISSNGDNYTTPKDLAKLAQHSMQSKNIASVVGSSSGKAEATNGRVYTWYNTNQLIGSYEGATGIKTGTGSTAGPCLVFAAERDGRTVIGVLLNSETSTKRYDDAQSMLDFAFDTETDMKLRKLPKGAERD